MNKEEKGRGEKFLRTERINKEELAEKLTGGIGKVEENKNA